MILYYWILYNNISLLSLNILNISFQKWNEASNNSINFKRIFPNNIKSKQNIIKIFFYKKNHGDNNNFDGIGKILAHSTPPISFERYGLFIHFDSEENWCYEENLNLCQDNYTSFLSVALHEIGHILGLYHSQYPKDIMFKYYNDAINLTNNDKKELDIVSKENIYFTYVRKHIKDVVLSLFII